MLRRASLFTSNCRAGWNSHGVHLCGLLLHADLGAVRCPHLLCHLAGESDRIPPLNVSKTSQQCGTITVVQNVLRSLVSEGILS